MCKFKMDIYLSHLKPDLGSVLADTTKFLNVGENGSARNVTFCGSSHYLFQLHQNHVGWWTKDLRAKRLVNSVSALKECCMMEGLGLVFQPQPPPTSKFIQKDQVYAQVVVGGQIPGKGIGLTWDEATAQAAEIALGSLTYGAKHPGSSRSLQGMSNKRMKQEVPRVVQRASSARYSKNAPTVP